MQIEIDSRVYDVYYYEVYTGGHGGGDNFPVGEFEGHDTEIVIDEVLDEDGNIVILSDILYTNIIEEILNF